MKKIYYFRCKNKENKKHFHFSIIANSIFEAYKKIEKDYKNIIVIEFLGNKEMKQTPQTQIL